MKIRVGPFAREGGTDLKLWIENELRPSAFSTLGNLETLQMEATNLRSSFSLLLETLAEKGVLSGQEIHKIVKDYDDPDADLIK